MSRSRDSDEEMDDEREEDEEKPSKKMIDTDNQITIPVKQTPDFEAMQIENNVNIKKILQILERK